MGVSFNTFPTARSFSRSSDNERIKEEKVRNVDGRDVGQSKARKTVRECK